MQRFDCLAKETAILGPHFLEASAGTGKTFAIEHVMARLLLSGKFALDQILVVTFTRAAARELKLRIRSNLDRLVALAHQGLPYLEEGANLRPIEDALATFEQCQIFTIHSFCSRMLTEFGESKEAGTTLSKREAGIRDFLEVRLTPELICPEQLEILLRWAGSLEDLVLKLKTTDASEQALTFAQRLEQFHAYLPPIDPAKMEEDWQALKPNYKKGKGDLEGQIEALCTGNFAKLIEEKGSIFEFLKPENKKVKAKEPTFLHYPRFFDQNPILPLIQSAADPKTILDTLLSVWKPIDRKILTEEGTLSNDELLYAMNQAVDDASFRQKIQQKYGAILIDEFQDTDPIQWSIFDRLFVQSEEEKTLYLIGDPKQSIYRFRKADLYTYLKAKQTIAPENHFYLDTNFRSSKAFLTALNHLFDRNWLYLPKEKSTMPYLPVRAGKDFQADFQDGKGAIHCVMVSKEDIYTYVANEIISLKTPHYRDWAILVKDRFEAAEMQRVLASVGIPSTCRGKEPLAQTLAFQAIYELLEALAAPQHLGKAKCVLAGPFGNVPPGAIEALDVSPFVNDRALLEEKGLSQFFQVFLAGHAMPCPQFHSDCWQVLEQLFEWEQRMGFTFDGALRFLDSLAREDGDDTIYQRKEEGEDDVQIMTVHMSKGLEFEMVFALGLASRTPAGDEEVEAEKQRLLYVAATRAKKRLYIPIPNSSREAAMGTHAPMELFCKYLSLERSWEEELQRISTLSSLTFEKVEGPLALYDQPTKAEAPPQLETKRVPLPPFQPSYLLSFTALSQGIEHVALDPLPEGDMPRGAETGVVIHRILERIFSEGNCWKSSLHVSSIVKEEVVGGTLALWEKKVNELVQATLDLPLPPGFCLRDLEAHSVRPEVEFMFESPPHFLKGFIDLLFRHEEKLYFVDWKTNWLKDYSPERLQEAMQSHKYDMQASIYAEALRKSGVAPSAIYLFVRGPCALCFEPA